MDCAILVASRFNTQHGSTIETRTEVEQGVAMTLHRHAGISCRLHGQVCRTIRDVLRVIGERRPQDLPRLRARVLSFHHLPRSEQATGTDGWFMAFPPRMVSDPVFGQVVEDDDQRRGVVVLPPGAGVATVAHELGHAMATDADLERRNAPEDEWASELAADYHAYRWGFGRAIARARPHRLFTHHGAGPGQRISVTVEGREHCWRVSRRFVMHRVEEKD